MKNVTLKCLVKVFMCVVLLGLIAACSKPESKLIGTWKSAKTASTIEFKQDKTGVISLKSGENLPPVIPFTWTVQEDGQFAIEIRPAGAPTPSTGRGKVEKDGTLVLEGDMFQKMK